MQFDKRKWTELSSELQDILEKPCKEATDHHEAKLYHIEVGLDFDKPMEWVILEGVPEFHILNTEQRPENWAFASEPFNVKE